MFWVHIGIYVNYYYPDDDVQNFCSADSLQYFAGLFPNDNFTVFCPWLYCILMKLLE